MTSLGKCILAGLVVLPNLLFGTATFADEFMPVTGRATQPVGHFEFCQDNPGQCEKVQGSLQPVELTRALWTAIVDINSEVNKAVIPMTDEEIWGREEYWSYPSGVGDCEDYALEKRRRLEEIGISPASLLVTVVRQTNGAGHAVLTVRTSRGDFILDNLESRVLAWNETEYRYLKRQSERHSGLWVGIEDGRDVLVGSLR